MVKSHNNRGSIVLQPLFITSVSFMAPTRQSVGFDVCNFSFDSTFVSVN